MIFHVLPTPQDVARFAASTVAQAVRENPFARIAIPTGKTPLLMYEELTAMHRTGKVDLSSAHWFGLDEFLAPALPVRATFAHFLRERLVRAAGLPEANLHVLNGRCKDPDAEARRYEQEIARLGGLSLAVLGVGRNGHIGFNEPGTSFDSRTGRRHLEESSRAANAYLFRGNASKVPHAAISMGIGTIMDAATVLVIATGKAKAQVVARLHGRDADVSLPISALLQHLDAILVTDEEASAHN